MGNKHRNQRGGKYGNLSGRKLDRAIDRQLAREKDAADRAAKRNEQRARWSKYSSSNDATTGTPQTDYFEGYVGETDQKKKVHFAIDENHEVVFVRDIDGIVLYDRLEGIGYLPPDLDWSGWDD